MYLTLHISTLAIVCGIAFFIGVAAGLLPNYGRYPE